jgi:hypothetical protein
MIKFRLSVLWILLFFVFIVEGQSQQRVEKLGKVTYKSSQNIYVKFENTEGIVQGDTLFTKTNGRLRPAVQVNFISTTSCAGTPINADNIKVSDELIAIVFTKQEEENIKIDTSSIAYLLPQTETPPITVFKSNSRDIKKNISDGRITIQSYSSFNPGKMNPDDQRWRYTVSYDADGIGENGLSISSYFSYAYTVGEWQTIRHKPWDYLKVYDLSLGYDIDAETNIRLGRYINPKISNLSSVDGLQFQKKFSNYFSGLLIGSRPDFATLNFNPKFFEYGGYIGRTDTIEGGIMENTIAFFQQTNSFKTDRRFMYFQHNNSILKDFNFTLSSELDLFALEKGVGKTKPSLTSLFLSARYSPARIISFSFSYDARKNVIYYETYRSFVDSLIENETRQGIRFGTNIRPFNNVFIGLNAGYRFLKKDIKPSKNFNGYVTYSQVPVLDISATISYSNLISSYVDGAIYGIRISKYLSFIDYSLSASYTKVEYNYLSSFSKLNQNNLSIDLSGRILDQLYLSWSYEGVFEKQMNYSRVLVDLSLRF